MPFKLERAPGNWVKSVFGQALIKTGSMAPVGENSEPDDATAAQRVGRTAGLFTKLLVRQALKSKTVREQVRDARSEASPPPDPHPQGR